MLIYYIEDNDYHANSWIELALEVFPDATIKWFEAPYDCWREGGNPDALILDIGSIGLMGRPIVDYLNVYYQLREKYTHTPIFLTSGLREVIVEMVREINDELCYPVSEGDWPDAMKRSMLYR